MGPARLRPGSNAGLRTRAICAAAGLAICTAATPAAVSQEVASARRASAPPSSALVARYRALEARLVSEGRLRTDRDARSVPWDQASLARDFVRIALSSEYRAHGGRFAADASPDVLRRWAVPVRIGVVFGPNLPHAERRRTLAEVDEVARRLSRATGHPVALTSRSPNLHVLVASEDELPRLGPFLDRIAPGLSRAGRRAILAMAPDTLCLALARPGPSPEAGYRDAVVVVRAEHSARMRRSCVEEELAQAMGLPGDSPRARPSIFNDDEEFGVLTRHDEALLAMLYDPRLRPGMGVAEAAPLLPAVAADAMAR